MPSFVIASTFYTSSLEKPFERVLGREARASTVLCVPYNQLQSFLLNPRSALSVNTPANVLLLLRVEDFIRLDLATPADEATCIRLLRERELQFLDVLSGVTDLRLTVMICPAGLGAYDTGFLGNAIRVAEHKIAAELRRQQKHLIVSWREFAQPEKLGAWLSPTADRLGHVPFTPSGLQAVADFFVSQQPRMPTTTLHADAGAREALTLEKFLGALAVEVSIAPVDPQDEQTANNLVRHTTHFINRVGGIWSSALSQDDPDHESWIVRVSDRFGNYDISGAVVFEVQAGRMLVEYIFLTCPVLGKQVELAFFSWLGTMAEQRGAIRIDVSFVQGRDNKVFADLLTRLSEQVPPSEPDSGSQSTAGTEKHFILDVDGLQDRIAAAAQNRDAFLAIVSNLKTREFANK